VNPVMHRDAYYRLAGMTALCFITMCILMYAMVNVFDNVFNSVNQLYMAGLMTAPMVSIELLVMGSMYPQKKLNLILVITAAVIGCVFFVMIRQQALVSDRQFLRSMIPHHAGAILMCEKSRLQSDDVKSLCASIISGQNAEIGRMRALLEK
jgi:uncharacterized protein (DUF305 family)